MADAVLSYNTYFDFFNKLCVIGAFRDLYLHYAKQTIKAEKNSKLFHIVDTTHSININGHEDIGYHYKVRSKNCTCGYGDTVTITQARLGLTKNRTEMSWRDWYSC